MSTLRKRNIFGCISDSQIIQILFFSGMTSWERSRSQFKNKTFFKMLSPIEVLSVCPSYVKSCISELFFPLELKLLRFPCFLECWFVGEQRSKYENDTFSKIYSSMKFLSIFLSYVNRYFLSHQWSLFSLWLKLLRLSCFWQWLFGGDQRLQFNNKTFSKVISAMKA